VAKDRNRDPCRFGMMTVRPATLGRIFASGI
jgi:hypothetical protein